MYLAYAGFSTKFQALFQPFILIMHYYIFKIELLKLQSVTKL